MDRKQQIYAALKPKAVSFGFTKKELMSVAALIDDNLALSDDANDEDVANAINEQIDAVVPILKFGQVYANRIIDADKKAHQTKNDGNGVDSETEDATQQNQSGDDKVSKDNETLKLLKSLSERFETVESELIAIKSSKATETRRSKIEAKVKTLGEYGKQILKNFDRMNFKDEDDFENYASDIDESIKAYNKEMAEKGLDVLGASAAGGGKPAGKVKELGDEEINRIVENIN